MFTEGENVWDYHRGRELEEETLVKPDEVEALEQHGGWKADRMVDVYTELSSWQEKAVSKAIHKAMKKSQASRSKQLRFSV